MNKAMNIVFILALFFIVGCVTGYKSLDEVPAKQRPIYDVTYNYMYCSLKNYAELVNASPSDNSGKSLETALQKLADKACDACGEELTAYSKFVEEKIQSQDIADTQAQNLRQQTSKKLVTMVLKKTETVE